MRPLDLVVFTGRWWLGCWAFAVSLYLTLFQLAPRQRAMLLQWTERERLNTFGHESARTVQRSVLDISTREPVHSGHVLATHGNSRHDKPPNTTSRAWHTAYTPDSEARAPRFADLGQPDRAQASLIHLSKNLKPEMSGVCIVHEPKQSLIMIHIYIESKKHQSSSSSSKWRHP